MLYTQHGHTQQWTWIPGEKAQHQPNTHGHASIIAEWRGSTESSHTHTHTKSHITVVVWLVMNNEGETLNTGKDLMSAYDCTLLTHTTKNIQQVFLLSTHIYMFARIHI